ncbi:50S ribosomal protein L25/general stress protein Ctc [uncultured Arcanobacterium sp.]|uniref:50S ribosomal protein L25/general stress protein Ctc n=1 Tax=uncultured Arcanobacterium sp. TaxID=487520 RepID=UPI002630D150|nr:50S ribosomal protein L25/general stress protein Ctc [uncultured Arcanobacterium sp.]
MADVVCASTRTEFGKGASRRLRAAGRTPAVVYGFGEAPAHIHFDAHDIFLEVRGNANALIKIELDGKEQLALVKDIQRNPLSRIIEHIDLLRVKADQKVEVEVPVVVEGEPFGAAIATVDLLNVLLMAPATAIPEAITINVEGAEDGTVIRLADVEFPANVEAMEDPDTTVVTIAVPAAEELPAAEEATEEAAEEPAAEEAAE